MRVLVVSKDESLAEYLRGQGHETKTVFTNDIAPRAAGRFEAEAVIYCATALALEKHEDVIRALQAEGRRVILIAGKDDPALGFAAALGVADLLTFPVDPADVLHRLENPATREEAADLVRRLAEGKAFREEAGEKRGKRRFFGLPEKKEQGRKEAKETPGEKRGFKPNLRLLFGKRKESAPEAGEEAGEPSPAKATASSGGSAPGPGETAPGSRPEERHKPPSEAEAAEALGLLGPGEGAARELEGGTEAAAEEAAPPALEPSAGMLWTPEGGRREAEGKHYARPAPPEAEAGAEATTPKSDGAYHAYRDALTGCFDRRYLLERFSLPGSYSVVFVDLDGFKAVNDTLGHKAGDRVLAAFGKMLNDHIKGRDAAVRWGGDEFVLILPDTPPKGAEKVVENLRRAWEKAAPDTGNLKVGFSAGVSSGKGADELTAALEAADKAMYAQKQAKFARQEAAQANPVPQVVIQAVPMPAFVREEGWWEETKRALAAVAVVLEAFVVLSAGIWLAHQALLLYGKSPPWLAKLSGAVVWFWSSVWTGIFG